MFSRNKEKIKRPLSRRIINYFIYTGVGIIILLLIAFGITQTSTFRDWLKDFIVEQVNTSTNGKLNIDRIDGTIFTSIILNNSVYIFDDDTVFSAEKIGIKTSPLKAIFKIIYFRKIEIDNAHIAFLKDENGELNISKIFPPSEETADTTTSSFDWKIQASDLSLNNVNFKIQSGRLKNSNAYYDHPDFNDLRLSNLNLNLSAYADIAGNEFSLLIDKLNVQPNISGFDVKNLSGNFILLNNQAAVTGLKIKTLRSDISIDAAISDFTPFSEKGIDIEKSPLRLDLDASDFNFDDLTTFVEATDLLKGNVNVKVSASGTLSDLGLENLSVRLNETNLRANGWLKDILSGGDMLINTRFSEVTINQDEVNNLLHTIDIPVYKDYGVLEIDSLFFEGKPLDFKAGLLLKTSKGSLNTKVNMDLSRDTTAYNINLLTTKLNLQPLINMNTNLNCSGVIKGKGFDPQTLNTEVQLSADGSSFENKTFQTLDINIAGKDSVISSDINYVSAESKGKLHTAFDFSDTTNSKYNFNMELAGLNLQEYIPGSNFRTDLNFTLKGEGESFDPDELNLFAVMGIDSSDINGADVDSTRIIIDIRSGEKERVINVISDLADITLTGSFNVSQLINMISFEAGSIAKSVEDKIDSIKPTQVTSGDVNIVDDQAVDSNHLKLDKNINLKYLLEFKNFELLSAILGSHEIEIDGNIEGEINTSGDSLSLNMDSKISYLKFWDGTELIYFSDFYMKLGINDRILSTALEELSADVNMGAKRIFAGGEIKNLNLDLEYENSIAKIHVRSEYEDYLKGGISGSIDTRHNSVSVILDTLRIRYNNYYLRNKEIVNFSYTPDEIIIKSFKVGHGNGIIDLNGNFSFSGKESLKLSVTDLDTRELSTKLLKISPEKSLDGNLNAALDYSGTADEPVIDLNWSLNNLRFQKINLGEMESKINYENKLLSADVHFNRFGEAESKPRLVISGTMPLNLSLNAKETLVVNKNLDMKFSANDFDLRVIGSLIPGIKSLQGKVAADINLNGTYDNVIASGNLKLTEVSFVAEANNLSYDFSSAINFNNDEINISQLTIKNSSGTQGGGTITGSGLIVHENFQPTEIKLNASGDLKILDEKSKAANPYLYGDISIRTRGDIEYFYNTSQNYINADLILEKGANVTFIPKGSALTSESDKFIYTYVPSVTVDSTELNIDSLISVSESRSESIKPSKEIPFDLNIKIQVKDEVKMILVLSQEFKQNLTAYLGGNFEYKVKNNVPEASGELELLEGSKLQFIKTFQAQGTVKFYDEIDNPYLNVVATYQSFYQADSANTKEVQIRIKLEGPVKNINTDFARNESNIEVYARTSSFGQFEPDATKSSEDALFFIIAGKFPEDATTEETNFVAGYAASLAGSLLGGFLNAQFGDFVKTVSVQQVGADTKINVIGKVGIFRYEIGGSSQVFQDLGRANIKIELPDFIIPKLVLRLERHEPSFQSTSYSEMINELGLKYDFEF